MKKALIVSNSSGLVSDFLENDISILKEKGYEIHCACNMNFSGKNTEKIFEKYGVKTIQVDFPIRNLDVKLLFYSYRKLKQIITKNTYDLVHCHSTIAAALTRQCTKAKRKNGLKVIYTSHGFPFYEGSSSKKSLIFYEIEKYYSKYTDAIITICNEDYENALKMKFSNVFKLNGVGVDISRFSNNKVNRDEYRKRLGFNINDTIMLSIGELNTNKNHEVIIRGLSMMKESDIIYAICGREVTEFGKKKELEKLASEFGVKVKFLGFRNDIPEVCYCSDLGAIPSLKEGLGLSGIEMLASGIPVVGSNRQGIKDYIKNGITGYVCEADSPESFAEGIRKTLLLKSKEKNLKNNCINMSKKFDGRQSYIKMKEIYTQIIG